MSSNELEKRIWTIGNAIISFAVFQSLAFAYLLRDPALAAKFNKCELLVIIAVVATLIITSINCLVIYWLNKKGEILRENSDEKLHDSFKLVYKRIYYGRIIVVIIFGLLSIGAIILQLPIFECL